MITLRSGKYHNNVECSTLTLIFNDWSYQVQGSISLQKKQLPLCLCFCFCFSCHSASLFSRPNFLKPKSRLFFPKFSETEPKTLINWQKFQNRNITLCRIHINMLFQLAENSTLLNSCRGDIFWRKRYLMNCLAEILAYCCCVTVVPCCLLEALLLLWHQHKGRAERLDAF